MMPTSDLTQDVFDSTVGDAIDVVTRIYVEARQCLLHIESALTQNSRSGLGIVYVHGESLGKMLWSDLRSWVGLVAGVGLAERQPGKRPGTEIPGEERSQRGLHEIKPGGQLVFAKIVLRVPHTKSAPHLLIGLVDQCRVRGDAGPTSQALRIPVGGFSRLVESMDDGLWQEEPVVVETSAPVREPKQGLLSVRLAATPVRIPLFDLQGPADLDRVVEEMRRFLHQATVVAGWRPGRWHPAWIVKTMQTTRKTLD